MTPPRRNDDFRFPIWFFSAIFAVPILVIVAFHVFAANQEAASYNRITGANVSWWDALWVDFRVIDYPKR